MATLDEVKAQIQTLKDDVATEASQVQASLKDLNDEVHALKDQIASGSGVSAADLDALLASIKGIDAAVQDIVPPGATPAPATAPAP